MKIHFIGIGGISMSGLAHMCLCQGGYEVSGSDWTQNALTDELQKLGAVIYQGQRAEHITDDIALVVFTAAVSPDNPELIAARQKGIPVITRSAFLGDLMKQYPVSIAIAGTHGKTTTTSMLAVLFAKANLDPTILVGGYLKDIGGNMKAGGQNVFITEACEYANSFLDMYPTTAIILNMEADHLDYFGTMDNIRSSFAAFLRNTHPDGHILLNGDDIEVRQLPTTQKALYFGRNQNNDAIITQETPLENGGRRFCLRLCGEDLGSFVTAVPGDHNVMNAAAAIIASYRNAVPLEQIRQGIASYCGVGRRFEYKGCYRNIPIYDDYAHHPSEIRASLSAARFLKRNRLIVAFQPHTFSRTHVFLDDFAAAFDETDFVLITDIYPAREQDTGLVHAQDLVEKMRRRNRAVQYLPDFEKAKQWLEENLQPGDVLFTIGAGNIYLLGEKLLESEKTMDPVFPK